MGVDNDAMLNVINLERFATHDGPGIRTVIFLKGCPLFCPWCANPETQEVRLPVLFHNANRCVGCRECERVCAPEGGAISFGGGYFSFDAAKCSECGLCLRACLHDALEFCGRSRTVREVLDVAERDRDYYEASEGGGITVSGGEPLLHREWALPLLREAHARGLNTAVETTGNVSWETIEAVEPHVDHFLYDFKHIDDLTLRRVAGGNGPLIKENLERLAATHAEKINAHIPVIPGFNYDRHTLVSMIDWLRGIGITRLNLLPYHTLGLGKYQQLHLEYQVTGKSLADDALTEYHEYALSLGMESKVGA